MYRKGLTNPQDATLVELLDHVMDNGIVVDPSARVTLLGVELRKTNEHLVVDSILTF